MPPGPRKTSTLSLGQVCPPLRLPCCECTDTAAVSHQEISFSLLEYCTWMSQQVATDGNNPDSDKWTRCGIVVPVSLPEQQLPVSVFPGGLSGGAHSMLCRGASLVPKRTEHLIQVGYPFRQRKKEQTQRVGGGGARALFRKLQLDWHQPPRSPRTTTPHTLSTLAPSPPSRSPGGGRRLLAFLCGVFFSFLERSLYPALPGAHVVPGVVDPWGVRGTTVPWVLQPGERVYATGAFMCFCLS